MMIRDWDVRRELIGGDQSLWSSHAATSNPAPHLQFDNHDDDDHDIGDDDDYDDDDDGDDDDDDGDENGDDADEDYGDSDDDDYQCKF